MYRSTRRSFHNIPIFVTVGKALPLTDGEWKSYIWIDDSVKKAVVLRCSSLLICLWMMIWLRYFKITNADSEKIVTARDSIPSEMTNYDKMRVLRRDDTEYNAQTKGLLFVYSFELQIFLHMVIFIPKQLIISVVRLLLWAARSLIHSRPHIIRTTVRGVRIVNRRREKAYEVEWKLL